MIGAILGCLCAAVAAVLLYLAAPHQKWGALPCRPGLLGWAGALSLALGTMLLLGWAGPATAIFILLTILMTIWSVVPVAIAWRRGAPEGKR